MKRIFLILLRIGVSVVLLVFLFNKVDKKSLAEIVKNANKLLLLVAFGVYFLSYILCLFRWEMLLRALKIHLPLKRIIISYAGAHFFSLFLPSTIGGDLMRSIDLSVHTKKPKEVIATVFLDRLSGYIALVLLALLSLGIGWKLLIQDKSVLLSVGIITAVLIAVLFVLFNRFLYSKVNKLLHSPNAGRIRELIKNLHQEIHYFRNHKGVIADNLSLSFLIQVMSPLTFFVLSLSIGLKVNIIYFFIFLPIIGAITLLPISIGGLGLRDATTIYFLAKAGVSRDFSFAMSLLIFCFILVIGAAGGLVYVLTLRYRRVQYHKAHSVQPADQK
jgi:hypothetical protein